jgi:carboxyl-terminal processing protease
MIKFIGIIALLLFMNSNSYSTPNGGFNDTVLINSVFKIINDNYLFSSDKQYRKWNDLYNQYNKLGYGEGAVHTIVDKILKTLKDPEVRLLTREEFSSLIKEVNGEAHTGLGLKEIASVNVNKKGHLIYYGAVPGSPAQTSGLQPGDRILKVNNQKTKDMQLEDFMSIIRVDKGKKIAFKVLSNYRFKKLYLVSDSIICKNELVKKVLTVDNKQFLYYKIDEFSQSFCDMFKQELLSIDTDNVHALLLDLRENEGGQVNKAIEMAGYFLGEKEIVQLENFNSGSSVRNSETAQICTVPVGVLVNSGTGGSSEIFASALQYYKRGVIVGKKTIGRGISFGVKKLNDDFVLVYPAAKIISAGSQPISQGVKPDITVRESRKPPVSIDDDIYIKETISVLSNTD